MILLDGKIISDQIKAEIAKEIKKDFLDTGKPVPHLAAVLEIGRASCRERVSSPV